MSDGKLRYIASSMDAKLPYTLTKGVTATRDGLFVYREEISWLFGVTDLTETYARTQHTIVLPWSVAAERLRYREGEPWCYALRDAICTGSEKEREILDGWVIALHRLAAILCDDADAFRVLHWCVAELGVAPVRQEDGDE